MDDTPLTAWMVDIGMQWLDEFGKDGPGRLLSFYGDRPAPDIEDVSTPIPDHLWALPIFTNPNSVLQLWAATVHRPSFQAIVAATVPVDRLQGLLYICGMWVVAEPRDLSTPGAQAYADQVRAARRARELDKHPDRREMVFAAFIDRDQAMSSVEIDAITRMVISRRHHGKFDGTIPGLLREIMAGYRAAGDARDHDPDVAAFVAEHRRHRGRRPDLGGGDRPVPRLTRIPASRACRAPGRR